MIKVLTIAVSFAILALAPSAEAQKNHMRVLSGMDTNADKKISKTEFNAFREKNFYKQDTNGDGSISMDEFLNGAAKKFSQRDKNGDGFISSDDFGRK